MSALCRVLAFALLTASTAVAQPDDVTRAGAHFERGMARYDAADYEQALAEFRAAYELAPNPAVLYNLARVNARLDHPVEAASFYERYLREAGDGLRRARRREVERALTDLRGQIGFVRVETNIEGAVIMVGGVDRATTPLVDPIRVEAGSVEIGARATGYDVAREVVSVAGGEEVLVRLTLRPLLERRGSIRIRSNLAGVEVRVDGAFVGTTPMTPTHLTSPGPHVVQGQRPGYLPAETTIDVQDAVESEARLELRRDPNPDPAVMGTVVLRTPVDPDSVRVDGETLEGTELELPMGPHDVRLELPERRPTTEGIEVRAGQHLVLQPQFNWTDAALTGRRESAAGTRRIGWVFLGAGAALAVVGLAPLIVAVRDLNADEHQTRSDMLDFCELPANRGSIGCSPAGGFDFGLEEQLYNDTIDRTNLLKILGAGGLILGGAFMGAGVVLLIVADSDEEIDAGANAQLRLGPGGLSLQGRF